MAQNFDTSDAPHITVAHCGGSLSLVGTDPRGMTVLGDENQLELRSGIGDEHAIDARVRRGYRADRASEGRGSG